ncbi:MAG: hypothetical protein CMM50_08600 [Rhodospirillaceae bacterium]|nr:hypothetical protein [Rhodospirillaceae bacterium]
MQINIADFALFPLEILVLFLSFLGAAFVVFALVPLGLQSIVGGWRINGRLSDLVQMRSQRQSFDLKTVASCFDVGMEGEGATSYLRSLQMLAGSGVSDVPEIGTSDGAARHFAAEKLPIRALRNVGLAIAVLLVGLCALSAAVLGVGNEDGGNLGSILLPAVVAFIVAFLAQATYLARWHQLQRSCATLDRLFLVPSEKLLLGQFRTFLEAESASHRVTLSAALRDAVGNAFAAPTAKLAEAATIAAADHSERVNDLLNDLLTRFSGDLAEVTRDQLVQLREILDAAVQSSETLRDSLAQSLQRIETDVSDPVRTLVTDLHESFVPDLRDGAAALREAAEALAETRNEISALAAAQPVAAPVPVPERQVDDHWGSGIDEAPFGGGRPEEGMEDSPEDRPSQPAQPATRASSEIVELLRELQRQARDLSGD